MPKDPSTTILAIISLTQMGDTNLSPLWSIDVYKPRQIWVDTTAEDSQRRDHGSHSAPHKQGKQTLPISMFTNRDKFGLIPISIF